MDILIYIKNQLNINQKEKKETQIPGQVFINCQFFDPEKQNEKEINNNIEESSKLLKEVINNMPKKEKEKYILENKKNPKFNKFK